MKHVQVWKEEKKRREGRGKGKKKDISLLILTSLDFYLLSEISV